MRCDLVFKTPIQFEFFTEVSVDGLDDVLELLTDLSEAAIAKNKEDPPEADTLPLNANDSQRNEKAVKATTMSLKSGSLRIYGTTETLTTEEQVG